MLFISLARRRRRTRPLAVAKPAHPPRDHQAPRRPLPDARAAIERLQADYFIERRNIP